MRQLFRITNGSRPLRGELAILVPTYRFDARARYTLAGMAALASDEIGVVIADNSESRSKWDFLHKLGGISSNIHVFCHKTNIGASRNWSFLLDRATAPFYLFVGDDDVCTPEYVQAGLDVLRQDAAVCAAAGRFLMVTSVSGISAANGARMEATPGERCLNFPIGGGNSLPNSIARRKAIEPYLAYERCHPLKASFFDWIMSYVLLLQGKYCTLDKGMYLYDVSNWESGDAYWKSNAKFYLAAGFPESFTVFHELYWAVELAHFFRGAYAPLSDAGQRRDCAQVLYLDRMGHFRRMLASSQNARTIDGLVSKSPRAATAFHELTSNDDALHPKLFDWFAQIIGIFDGNCAAAYLDFVNASIERATNCSPQ